MGVCILIGTCVRIQAVVEGPRVMGDQGQHQIDTQQLFML